MGVPRARRQIEFSDVQRVQLATAAPPHTAFLPLQALAAVAPAGPAGPAAAPTGVLVVLVLAVMALVLLAAVSCQCAATWRWLKQGALRGWKEGLAGDLQSAVRISHSLPDLKRPTRQESVQDAKNDKKVLRQTTLPAVTSEQQKFQRQLSYRIDPVPLGQIQFSVCSLDRSNDTMGNIKPELYREEALKRGSADSTGDMECCGKLHFAIRYDSEMEALVVKVLQARDLPIKDVTGSSDPYVKIYLLPDRKKKYQTKVHRRNLNPIFNETFIFSVTYDELRRRCLSFSVYDFDRFSRHDLIGHVVLKGLLDVADLSQEIEYTMNILNNKRDKVDLGELMLSLCYLPTAGRLTVTVIKARSLKAMDITGSSDPYVKVYLLCQGRRIKKRKTTVKRSTLTPVYNEALVFDVPQSNVEDVSLIIKVIDYDRIGHNEPMGCCGIGPAFVGVGRDHWQEMLDTPRKPVAQWYTLMEAVPVVPGVTDLAQPSLSCLTSAR